jgi:hypothetical protein
MFDEVRETTIRNEQIRAHIQNCDCNDPADRHVFGVHKLMVSVSVRRNRKSGMVLISTLLSLMLIVGVWSVVQATSNSNTLALAKITKNISQETRIDTVGYIFAPLILQALTDPDNREVIALNGTPYTIAFQQQKFMVSAQDIEGLVDIDLTSPDVIETLLPRGLDISKLLEPGPSSKGLNLTQSLALLGFERSEIARLEPLVTQQAKKAKLNATSIYIGYEPVQVSRRHLMLTHPQLLRTEVQPVD